jgi:cytochrome c553
MVPVMRASLALAFLLVIAPSARGADARVLAAGCAACHGTNGHALDRMPVLAGTPAGTIRTRLLEFRDGRKPGTVMPQLAKGYTEAEIDALDAWFAAQPPSPAVRR